MNTSEPELISPSIEWVEFGGATPPEAPEPIDTGRRRGAAVIAALAFLGLILAWSVSSREPSTRTDPIEEAPPTSAVPNAPADSVPIVPDVDIEEQAPTAWLEGRVLGYVDPNEHWIVVDLGTGDLIETPGFYDELLPPMPRDARLIHGPNMSFAIESDRPERSGQISNRVRVVRMSNDANVERFAFIETLGDGTADVFVGSLWAPTTGLPINVDATQDVQPIDGRGVLLTNLGSTSSYVNELGLIVELPTELGRIVAANEEGVIVSRCDEDFVCTSQMLDWTFQSWLADIPPELSLAPILRISPNGMWLAASDPAAGWWTIHRIGTSDVTPMPSDTVPNATLAWSRDSTLVAWDSLDGHLLVANASIDSRPLVRKLISAETLAGSELFLSAPSS